MKRRIVMTRRRWIGVTLATLLLLPLIGAAIYAKMFLTSVPIIAGFRPQTPASLASWPWPQSTLTTPHRGLKQWMAMQSDGTSVDLLQFDFAANPKLKLELFDQDQDDEKPFDNDVHYWQRGAGQITQQLNRDEKQKGRVVALWNGLFFGYTNKQFGPGGRARHVSPVVLGGKVLYTHVNHRWTFGWKLRDGRPHFDVLFKPGQSTLRRAFDWGAGAAQCLIRQGKPLKLEPFPRNRNDFKPQPVPSTPQEAGHIPIFDHMKTCRVSMAWPRDSSKLWLLVVKEPDIEAGSAVALKQGIPVAGGWTVPDVQRFWQAFGGETKRVWGAVNSDAGDVAQLVYARRGAYEMIPPRWNVQAMRIKLKSDFSNAPHGGAIMYFAVRDQGFKP